MEESSSDSSGRKYKGVRKRKWGKWVSEIRLPNSRERIWLGSYDTPEKAARAFDAALYCLRGPEANFNFPYNPPEIPGGRSLAPSEIQAVASRFANEEPVPVPPPRLSNYHPDHAHAGSGGDNSSRVNTETSSSPVSDGIVPQAGGEANFGWSSFLNFLDSNDVASDYGLYGGPDCITGEFYHPSPPSPSPDIYDSGDNIHGDDGYTHPSFLWNF